MIREHYRHLMLLKLFNFNDIKSRNHLFLINLEVVQIIIYQFSQLQIYWIMTPKNFKWIQANMNNNNNQDLMICK